MILRKRIILVIFLCLANLSFANAQVEHVPVSNPVYEFLLHAETRGFLPHHSLSSLPLQRKQIIDALKLIDDNASKLAPSEKKILDHYKREFDILSRDNAVIFHSGSDSAQVLSGRIISDSEKYIYHYSDSLNSVNIKPLGSIDAIYKVTENDNRNVLFGNLGGRLYGTIDNRLGYYLQATNGVIISGEKQLALELPRLRQNVKFSELNSDFDFTESHVIYQQDWFYGGIGRETRLHGAGLNQRLYLSGNAPPMDALFLGVRFKTFEYQFIHAGLFGLPKTFQDVGYAAELTEKYAAFHRFAIKPSWGEIAFWENIVYSDRTPDITYLNPLSFFKSLEHSLRDRDNSLMGGDFTVRPFNGLQLKGTFILDDIIFSKIGENYWSNKTAWNIAAIAALPGAFDLGMEYTRVEPYTFSHFNPQNSVTNDSLLYGSYIPPNSDEIGIKLNWWWGGRYPLTIESSYMRHGRNIYEGDSLIFNAGGDPLQSRRNEDPATGFEGDPMTVDFLGGDLQEVYKFRISGAVEIIRGLNFHIILIFNNINGKPEYGFRTMLSIYDF